MFVADGSQYFNRPGPRLCESLEILAEVIHPEVFPARFQGSGWVRYADPEVDSSSSATSLASVL